MFKHFGSIFTLTFLIIFGSLFLPSEVQAQVKSNASFDPYSKISAALGSSNTQASNTSSTVLTYQSGYYTNLCGTGTAATANSCNKGCNPATGSCSSSTASVVKHVCDGRTTECRSNESSFATTQSLAGAACGKTVQIDVFTKNCRAGNAQSWTCSQKDLVDYMVWYSGDCATTPPQAASCNQYQPLDTQLRLSGQQAWVDGRALGTVKPNSKLNVNCFAQNGSSLLPDARIVVTKADGSSQTFTGSELRGYVVPSTGNYDFRCESTTFNNCYNSDTIYVANTTAPTSPTPTPSSAPETRCLALEVTSGNNSLVPATVKLHATAAEPKSAVTRYRYYFGDGQQTESTSEVVEHRYESSGTFVARAEVRDTRGNWKSGTQCETKVFVKPAAVESHKSNCSDVFFSTTNNSQAPSTVTFDINGYDNKGDIQAYRIETGTGQVLEESDDKLEFRYDQAGTFTIKAYIKDSRGNWQGGNGSCQKNLYIITQPLTKQPSTGTPTWLTIAGFTTGGVGLGLQALRRKLEKWS